VSTADFPQFLDLSKLSIGEILTESHPWKRPSISAASGIKPKQY